MNKIRVFIVDDSAVVRQVMSATLSADPGIEVLGAALDPIFAWDRMKRDWPDVIILDIEMPRMDGLTFLRKIMAEHPTPVIICSTLTDAGTRQSMEALSAGAVEVLPKGKSVTRTGLDELGPTMVATVKAAARANMKQMVSAALQSAANRLAAAERGKPRSAPPGAAERMAAPLRQSVAPRAGAQMAGAPAGAQTWRTPSVAPRGGATTLSRPPQATAAAVGARPAARIEVRAEGRQPVPDRYTADAILPPPNGATVGQTERIVAIGTSTGGTQALELVLTALPRNSPGIVIVQHMPEKFTAPFAARLNERCHIEVREAAEGDVVQAGRALIAPGGRHLIVRRQGSHYVIEVRDGPPVNRHRPSVDVLFRSVAKVAGKNALGIIMTGMGDDGAAGLLEMRQCGALTIAESEETCVVFGMPREAIRRGAADRVLPLPKIPGVIASGS